MATIKQQFYKQLSTAAWPDEGLSPVNKLVAFVIIFSIILVTLETEPTVFQPHKQQFLLADDIIGILFVIEYVLRLWVMGEDAEYKGLKGRLKYMLTPRALVDLFAVLPFFLGWVGSDIFILRLARLVRIYTLSRLGDFSIALKHIRDAITERFHELLLAFAIALITLLCSSTLMFLIEGPVQPDAFGSIPRALWWGVLTLTSVGYGDVIPMTIAGRICCSITAFAAIGLIAMPTGILAAAFSDAFQRHKNHLPPKRKEPPRQGHNHAP